MVKTLNVTAGVLKTAILLSITNTFLSWSIKLFAKNNTLFPVELSELSFTCRFMLSPVLAHPTYPNYILRLC